MKSKLQLFWLGIALSHLSLVFLGARAVDLSQLKWVGKPLDYYGLLSGSGYDYGFFAPGIGGQVRVLFDVTDTKNRTKTVTLDALSREEYLRLGTIGEQILDPSVERQEEFRRALAASVAGTVFARYPEAHQVRIRVEGLQPVSMEEYRAGIRAMWEPIYEAKFVH